MPVFAEGRVEHQKQNQTATSQWPVGFVFGVQLDYSCRLKSVSSDAEKVRQAKTFIKTKTIRRGRVPSSGSHGLLHQVDHFLTDMSNRVEHPKRNQPAIEMAGWFRFWCSTRLLMSVKKCST